MKLRVAFCNVREPLDWKLAACPRAPTTVLLRLGKNLYVMDVAFSGR